MEEKEDIQESDKLETVQLAEDKVDEALPKVDGPEADSVRKENLVEESNQVKKSLETPKMLDRSGAALFTSDGIRKTWEDIPEEEGWRISYVQVDLQAKQATEQQSLLSNSRFSVLSSTEEEGEIVEDGLSKTSVEASGDAANRRSCIEYGDEDHCRCIVEAKRDRSDKLTTISTARLQG